MLHTPLAMHVYCGPTYASLFRSLLTYTSFPFPNFTSLYYDSLDIAQLSMEDHCKIHNRKLLLLMPLSPAMAPTASHGALAGHAEDSPLDFDVVVILAAMLCALVCVLGLNSMLHCVVRCTQRMVTDPVEWVQSRRNNGGLKKEDVKALPTATYANSGSPASTSCCMICLAEFADGEKVRVIPKCNHRFHVACIDKWLLSHSSCPTCRLRISMETVTV